MTEELESSLRAAAERAASTLREALVRHAETMSAGNVRYSAVAEADDRVLDALHTYRAAVEQLTGQSVLLRLPIEEPLPADDPDIPEEDAPEFEFTTDLVLEARWFFRVDPPRLVRSIPVETDVPGLDPELAKEDFGALQQVLAAIFERDVTWPPPEYATAGLDIVEMDVAVYPQEPRYVE